MNVNEGYEEFFRRANASAAFSSYCADAYGIDLSQTGYADRNQVDYMLTFVHFNKRDRGLQLGCGNGKMAEFIARQTQALMYGIDPAKSAIAFAERLAENNANVRYERCDLDRLSIPDNEYTAMFLVDTLCAFDDCEKTLSYLYDRLMPGGRIGIFHSDVITNDEGSSAKTPIDRTKIATVIANRGWTAKSVDFTDQHIAVMQRRSDAYRKHKASFESEGNACLLARLMEAAPASRYLYCVYK